MSKSESVLQRLALPAEFGVVLLVFCFALSVTPYLTGADFGVVKIPTLDPRTSRRLRLLGPLALVLAIFLHLPIFPPKNDTSGSQTHQSITDKRDATKTSTVVQLTDSDSTTATIKNKVPVATRPTDSAYRVSLVIPTSTKVSAVRVDGRKARILSRAASVITIEVSSTHRNQRIELEKADGTICTTELSITRDMTLAPCQS